MQILKSQKAQTKSGEGSKQPSYNFSAFANITEQYASEAAFLWLLRSRALTSPLYHSVDMIELESRIEASLQGLTAANEIGWQACMEALRYEEAGEVFTAAVIAFRDRNATKIKMVCELALTTPAMSKGLISALGWVEPDIATFWIQRFLSVSDPRYKTLGLAVCGARREYPDKHLLKILQAPETIKQPALHARALRLIGELKRWDLVPALNAGMDADDSLVQFWANWSATLLGNQAACQNLKTWVMTYSDLSDRAIQMAFSLLPVTQSRRWIAEMVKKPERHRQAIKSIGVLGDPQAIPWLIQLMDDLALKRIAGWAFSQITGVDLEKTNLTVEPPENIDAAPTDDPKDKNVLMDEDDDLPWPDKNKVNRLWQVHSRMLQAGQRYFQGQEITKQLLSNIFVSANQQQKSLAALQRAIYDKHTMFVNINARNID